MTKQSAGTVKIELPGTGEPILDGGAEILFMREFEAAFGVLMIEWWSADPDALAASFPADA